MTSNSELPPNAIAVVGMAARLPGANTLSAFWDNLRRGEESIVTLAEDDLLAEGIPEKSLANHAYVRRAALVDGIDEFDADFFGFTPQVARSTDPQHRLFLQTAFHAIEDAGYDPAEIEGSVGVYATSTTSGYLLHNIMSNYDPNVVMGQGITFDMVNLSLQNDKDYLATKLAYALNLRGPALSVQTACSSALVAVHLACQSILNGECEMALAGGASLRIPHHVGYWYAPGSMVSPTGHCRPFDARSDGTIFGSGVGVVVLKALQDAVDDGDRIHAVIRGSALNNDGSTKMTYAAPTAAGQADVIAEAHAIAEVDSSEISYIETHGTGTPLGDPIEIEGLRQAFEVSDETALRPVLRRFGQVQHRPPGVGRRNRQPDQGDSVPEASGNSGDAALHQPEPRIAPRPWTVQGSQRIRPVGMGRRAARRCQLVRCRWHQRARGAGRGASRCPASTPQPGPQVLLLSARSTEALQQSRTALAAEISGDDAAEPARRRLHPRPSPQREDPDGRGRQRRAGRENRAGDRRERQRLRRRIRRATCDNSDQVVFLFPGQGAQHVGMARGLYDAEPVFAEHFDQCAAGFGDELGIDLRAEIFEGTARNLERTDRTQPALFTVEYALAKLIESYGVRPAALVGHSIGEYVAGTIAGVFDIETAIKVVSMRARLMHAAPRGVDGRGGAEPRCHGRAPDW